jgi:ubiquinone/menaquinone biosynthesis C-methylase UbiE
LVLLNPLNSFLWMLRRNERDIVNFYNFLTPFVQVATGGNMINFGYWNKNTKNPLQAQYELCTLMGEFADLHSARKVMDVGSGFSAPAIHWKSRYNFLTIVCININLQQLEAATKIVPSIAYYKDASISQTIDINGVITLANATATILPFVDHCVDRVVALESAQHFKPLIQFIRESRRVLKYDGLLVIAIPVITTVLTASLMQFIKLGILSLTWASEHYKLTNIKSIIANEGFTIKDILFIGSHVYAPLTNYYIQNRKIFKDIIMKERQSYFQNILYNRAENIVYKSALKMKDLSEKGIIDYVLIKATKS